MVDYLINGEYIITNKRCFLKKKLWEVFLFYSRISVKNAVFLNMQKKLSKNSEFYWKKHHFCIENIFPGHKLCPKNDHSIIGSSGFRTVTVFIEDIIQSFSVLDKSPCLTLKFRNISNGVIHLGGGAGG